MARKRKVADLPMFDVDAVKEDLVSYCKKRGALAVGVADVEVLERIAPPGHGPRALMPRVRGHFAGRGRGHPGSLVLVRQDHGVCG